MCKEIVILGLHSTNLDTIWLMYSRAENWSCLKPFCGVIFMRGWGGSPMSGRWGLAILLACWVDWGCQCPPECRHNQPAGCFEWFVRREHHGCLGIRDISLESPHASSVSCGFHPSHSQDSLRGRSCWCQPRAVGGVFLFVYLMGLFLQRPVLLQVNTFILNIWIALSSMRKLAFFMFWKWY